MVVVVLRWMHCLYLIISAFQNKYVCINIYIYICKIMYMYIFLYIHIHTEKIGHVSSAKYIYIYILVGFTDHFVVP